MGELDGFSLRVGFCLGLFLPFVAFVIRWVWGRIKAPFNPQVVVQKTKQTPSQVVAESLEVIVLLAIIAGLAVGIAVRLELVTLPPGI